MKVLYLLRYYPALSETFVANELGALAAHGVSATVASLGVRADAALAPPSPVPVLEVPRRPLSPLLRRTSPGEAALRAWQRPKDARRYAWLRDHLPEVDHVHVHFAGEAAEWAYALSADHGLPYTVTVHAADLHRPRPSLAAVLGGARRVLAVSEHGATLLRALTDTPVDLVRCGPDLTRWNPEPLPAGPLAALFLGRNVPKKGLPTLVQAWGAGLPDGATLSLITDPAPAPLPPGVRALGLLRPDEVQRQIRAHNLVVLPCQRAPDGDLDGVPLALMEALALGRPVLSTTVGGVPELLAQDPARPEHSDVGWLVPPEDPAALRAALIAATAPDARAIRGAGGPARLASRGFSLEAQVAGVLRAWGSR